MESNELFNLETVIQYIEDSIYKKTNLVLSDLHIEKEGKAYQACYFKLNHKVIHSRLAKVTPKKIGQFVTFWKRNSNAITEPYNEEDDLDFLVINVKFKNRFGQFVFPKSILIKKGIISTSKKEGKRGFRVYPIWNIAKNKQSIKTQKWQLDYFLEFNQLITTKKINSLYHNT